MMTNEELKNMIAELGDEDLTKVTGGVDEGEMYWIGAYTCPFCHKEHEMRFTWNLASSIGTAFDEAAPCGSGRRIWRIFMSESDHSVMLVDKNGKAQEVDFRLMGGGVYGKTEIYF